MHDCRDPARAHLHVAFQDPPLKSCRKNRNTGKMSEHHSYGYHIGAYSPSSDPHQPKVAPTSTQHQNDSNTPTWTSADLDQEILRRINDPHINSDDANGQLHLLPWYTEAVNLQLNDRERVEIRLTDETVADVANRLTGGRAYLVDLSIEYGTHRREKKLVDSRNRILEELHGCDKPWTLHVRKGGRHRRNSAMF